MSQKVTLLLIFLLFLAGGLIAQGETYTGYMGDDVADDEYPLSLEAGQTVRISMTRLTDNLDPFVGLRGPEGDIVAQNDDADSTTLDSELEYTAQASGEYTVIASNIRNTSGDYQLIVEVVGTMAQDAPTETETYTGYMGDDVADDEYPLSLEAGQTVRISMTRLTDNLDPFVGLRGPEGDIVAQNDDADSTTLDSELEYTAQASGEYTVIASNIRNTSGDYQLTVEVTGTGDGAAPTEQPTSEPYDEGREPTETHTGYMGNDVADDSYSVTLSDGEALVATVERLTDDLDPVLILLDSDGEEVALNDDRDSTTLDSRLVYAPEAGGTFELVVTNISGTSGEYQLAIYTLPAEEATPNVRVFLSGEALTYDTEHFRIHYTLEGADAATEDYVITVGEIMEEVYEIQINQMGWPLPPTDGDSGGDSRFDVYLADLLTDDFEGEMGSAAPDLFAGDNPNTLDLVEEAAIPSYIQLDNDYSEMDSDPIGLLRATAAHEFHHSIQFGYDSAEPHDWIYEATSTWMETQTFPEFQDATGYVIDAYSYPEVCFGADALSDPTGGFAMYAHWMFVQSLVDAHDEALPLALWRNIAQYDGWDAVERTLSAYDDTLTVAVERYHLQNLVRDYDLTPEFDDVTVWLENTIGSPGEWTFTGQGIQELAANYYRLTLDGGVYKISVDNNMALWGVGIQGDIAEAVPLGGGDLFDTSAYEAVYVMVFNPAFDDDLSECAYQDYSLSISTAEGEGLPPAATLDASQYTPLN